MEPEVKLIRRDDRHQTHHDSGLFWVLIILVMVLLVVSLSIFGPTPPESQAGATVTPTPLESQQSRVYTVSYRAGVFSPTNLRIHAGDTVRFRNDGILPIRIVTDPYPEDNGLVGFDSIGDVPPGSYFAFTFAARGIFGYHNEHSPDETGTIIVR